MAAIQSLTDYDLKSFVSSNRLLGLWRMMTGFRLKYMGAVVSIGISATAKTATYFLLRYFVDTFFSTQSATVSLPMIALGFHRPGFY